MSRRKETRLPALTTLESIKEALDVRLGRRGDPLDRALTVRDLFDAGFPVGGLSGAGAAFRTVTGGVGGGLPERLVPPAPENLMALSIFGGIHILWDSPGAIATYVVAEISRSTSSDPETRQVLTYAGGNSYLDLIDGADQVEYFYWVRYLSISDHYGPYAGPVAQTTMPLVSDVMERLTGQIDETLLAQTLREEIEKIDIHDTRFGEVEDRLDTERDRLDGRIDEVRDNAAQIDARLDTERDRLDGRIDEARDNAAQIDARLDTERDRLDGRVDDALQNVVQVDARVDETRSRLDDRVDELRGEIIDVDTSAADRIAEERDARLAALDDEATARGAEIDAERVARVAAIQAEAEERDQRFLQWEADYELDRGLYAAQLAAIAAAYNTRAATIYSLEEVRITDREATATRINGIEVRVDDSEAGLYQEQIARANADSALASQISVLSAKIDALPTFANGFEAGLEFDRWEAAAGHAIVAETGDPFAGDQSALISSTVSSVDTSSTPFAVSSRIPSGTAEAFASRRLRITVAGRAVSGGSSEFGVGYAIEGGWFSGWTMFAPQAGWTIFEATVEVPEDVTGDHYVVVWGDTSGAGGAVEVDRLLVDVADSEIPEITAQIEALQQAIVGNEQAMAQQLTALESQFGDSFSTLEQDFQTVSDATSALGQQITTVDARVDTSRALIQDESRARADSDSALASDIQTLTATTGDLAADIQTERIARADGDEALASDITDLWAGVGETEARITDEARVRTTEDEILASVQRVISASKGASSATTVSLEEVRLEDQRVVVARFDAIEGEVEDAKGSITDIQDLNLSPDSALITRFSEVEGRVGDTEGSITDIQNLDLSPDSALITRFSEVEGRVGDTEGSIVDIQDLNLSPDSALITRFSEVEGRVGEAEGSITSIENLDISPDSVLATRLREIDGEIEDSRGSIKSIEDLTLSPGSALIGRFEQVEGEVEDARGAITNIENLDISSDSALVERFSQIEAEIGEDFASVRQEMRADIDAVTGDVNAMWNVRVTGTSADGKQVLGGIGLGTEGETVDVVFDVDRVAFGRTSVQGRRPFIIDGGVTYLDEAMIRDASIQEAKIGPITVGKLRRPDGTPVTTVAGLIRADALDVNNLAVAEASTFTGVAQSANYAFGRSGWVIRPNGDVEFNQGKFNGQVEFKNVTGAGALASKNSLTYAEVTGTKPPTNADRTAINTAYDTARVAGTAASTVRDRANNANTRVNDWVRPDTTLINGNKIYTGDAYVDTLQIKGNAVTVPASSSGQYAASTSIYSPPGGMQAVVTGVFTQGNGRGGVLVYLRHNGGVVRQDRPIAGTTGAMATVLWLSGGQTHTFRIDTDSNTGDMACTITVLGVKR